MSEPRADALALAGRSGLPVEMRYLIDALPRDRWDGCGLPETATFWLHMHAGFRTQVANMIGQTTRWREGGLEARGLHDGLLPTLQGFLQHLDGHHRIESSHYFPAFRRIEPRIAAGIDLLDRDHDAIHAHLEALFNTGLGLHRVVTSCGPNVADHAARLAEALDRAAGPLNRHLEDEEDIVIPLLSMKGDPLRD